MILRMTLERPIQGYWDGGPKAVFDFRIDGSPQSDARGRYIKVGSFGANHWFHVSMSRTVKMTLANVRRRLTARMKQVGERCRFEYLESVPGYFERQVFGNG